MNFISRWLANRAVRRLAKNFPPPPDDSGRQDAQEAVQRAQQALEEAKSRRPEVEQVAASLRRERELNGFGARLALSYRLKETH